MSEPRRLDDRAPARALVAFFAACACFGPGCASSGGPVDAEPAAAANADSRSIEWRD